MNKTKSEQVLLLTALVFLTAGIALAPLHQSVAQVIAITFRLIAILLLSAFAWRRRSLTSWIFVAMVAGAEIGFDAPSVAVNLRFLSDIFLRLIKTIVAPLILATLITGIAGHGDLKSVGRIGIKSLIFFEIATTLAIIIGLVSINFSHAGAGLSLAASSVSASPSFKVMLKAMFPGRTWCRMATKMDCPAFSVWDKTNPSPGREQRLESGFSPLAVCWLPQSRNWIGTACLRL